MSLEAGLAPEEHHLAKQLSAGSCRGAISSHIPWRRALGITPSRAAIRPGPRSSGSGGAAAAAAGPRAGGAGSRSRRSSYVSSRWDSRSHAATRVIRRKVNRSHMIGDHHGQTVGRAILLVRAMDGVLGTHRDELSG
jgi:hypothetical protein